MSNSPSPLTDEERAELEQLRAEKAAREEERRIRAERSELEQLRSEKAQRQREDSKQRISSEEDVRVREARERGRKLMEPDDDLSMPLGQKIVLAAVVLMVIAIVATMMFGPK